VDVVLHNGAIESLEGAACRRGRESCIQEVLDPRRMLSTTVRLRHADRPLLPVRTCVPIPRDRIPQAMGQLREIAVEAPVRMGDVVFRDLAGTGIDVVAAESAPRQDDEGSDRP